MLTRAFAAPLASLLAVALSAGTAAAQPVLGKTPVPTKEDLDEQRKFVAGVVDPRNTLDLIVGRPRVILLNVAPSRTLIADESTASFSFLGPKGTQMVTMGTRVGTTVLYLWFPDPDDHGKDRLIGYLVRVLPDPEAKARRAAGAAALAGEVNGAFPNSRVRLTPAGAATLLSGQVHDAAEAVKILQVLR